MDDPVTRLRVPRGNPDLLTIADRYEIAREVEELRAKLRSAKDAIRPFAEEGWFATIFNNRGEFSEVRRSDLERARQFMETAS